MIATTASSPLYRRRLRRGTPSFEQVFGVFAPDVLKTMTQSGEDLVAREPRVGIEIASVGYEQSNLLVQIGDPLGSGEAATAVCTIRIGTAVPANRRGVHMSRIGNVLAQSLTHVYPDLETFSRELARRIAEAQYGGATTVKIAAAVPYIEQVSEDPAKRAVEHLHLLVRTRIGGDAAGASPFSESGLRFSHIVACPCVQKTFKYACIAQGTPWNDDLTAFTHSQRCVTTLVARGVRGALPVARLLDNLDGVIARTMNTLPRGDELAMVFRAHRTPQFIEDALRESLWALCVTLGGPDGFAKLTGTSKSAESIHEFDLAASAVVTPETVRNIETASGGPERP